MTVGQKVIFEYLGNNYIFTVNQATLEDEQESDGVERGILGDQTYFIFEASNASGIKVLIWLNNFFFENYHHG